MLDTAFFVGRQSSVYVTAVTSMFLWKVEACEVADMPY